MATPARAEAAAILPELLINSRREVRLVGLWFIGYIFSTQTSGCQFEKSGPSTTGRSSAPGLKATLSPWDGERFPRNDIRALKPLSRGKTSHNLCRICDTNWAALGPAAPKTDISGFLAGSLLLRQRFTRSHARCSNDHDCEIQFVSVLRAHCPFCRDDLRRICLSWDRLCAAIYSPGARGQSERLSHHDVCQRPGFSVGHGETLR